MNGEKRRVVIASRNPDKVRELTEIFRGMPFELVSAEAYEGLPEIVEDGTTIEGNATRKALLTAAYTGEIAVADDTSLQVRELNELPDIFAARFSGPEATYESNARLLLELMENVPDGSRQARFATACVWVDPRPGAVAGQVARPARRRWLHNPWARDIMLREPAEARAFWNGLLDRDAVWARYRTDLLTSLVSWGHDRAAAKAVAERLLDACCGESAEAVALPDPRLWVMEDRDEALPPPTLVAPAGLEAAAPGRAVNEDVFLELTAMGRLLGTVARQPVGTAGFGYDPVFVPGEGPRTLAEFEPEEKNAISHRGRALRRLLAAVRQAYGLA